MTIQTCFESNKYRYDYDTQYGTGWFVRKSDDHVSLMNTGAEAYEEWQRYKLLADTPNNRQDFDEVAEAQEYSPRWGE